MRIASAIFVLGAVVGALVVGGLRKAQTYSEQFDGRTADRIGDAIAASGYGDFEGVRRLRFEGGAGEAYASVTWQGYGTLEAEAREDRDGDPRRLHLRAPERTDRNFALTRTVAGGWEVRAASAGVIGACARAAQTVFVTSVRIGDRFVVSDPSRLIEVNRDMPRYREGQLVTVRATVANGSPAGRHQPSSYVFLSTGSGTVRMRDDGSASEGGGCVYGAGFVVSGGAPGVRHLIVRVLDAGSVAAEYGGECNLGGWSLPYVVE